MQVRDHRASSPMKQNEHIPKTFCRINKLFILVFSSVHRDQALLLCVVQYQKAELCFGA